MSNTIFSESQHNHRITQSFTYNNVLVLQYFCTTTNYEVRTYALTAICQTIISASDMDLK